MYVPGHFSIDEAEAVALTAAHPLAQLVVVTPAGLLATPVPLVWRAGTLVGHLARPNHLWRHPGPALALFSGPQSYVSPNWYPSKAEHGKVVPTWNYTSVHVHGTLTVHDDHEWKRDVLALLTHTFEAASADPWRMTDAPAGYIDGAISGVVGIELVDVRIEGKAKLSQNRDDADRLGVVAGLASGPPNAVALAQAMQAPSADAATTVVPDSPR